MSDFHRAVFFSPKYGALSSSLDWFFFIFIKFVVYLLKERGVGENMYHNMQVETERLLEGINSLPPPCGFQELSSGYEAWQQMPLSTKLSL